MKKILAFFKGYKTYIVVVAGLVYGVLALAKIAPDPNQLGVYIVAIMGLAGGFRSAIQPIIDAAEKAKTTP
jgi:hypothetical protein